jgi:hypothetical protein
VFRFEIPSQDSDSAVDEEIGRVRLTFSTPRSLVIIHYGGHVDPDVSSPEGQNFFTQKSVWAANSKSADNTKLDCSDIQPQLRLGKGDFLVILDCCFGAQAARTPTRPVIPSNVELLVSVPSKTNVTICLVATSSFSPRPLQWETSYQPVMFS